MTSLNFLCDERVQRLSAQAESFLNRVREVFSRYPMALDEHGRAPADPAQLRNLTYPHKPDIRHTYVERWFVEIESASLVTVVETALGRRFELADAETALRAELVTTTEIHDGPKVIHNSGHDPPKIANELAAAAASAASFIDLIRILKPFYPRHDLALQAKLYRLRRDKQDQPYIAVSKNERCLSFVKWLDNADVPIPRIESPIASQPTPIASQDEPDLFDQKFLQEYERKKARKTGRGGFK